MGDTATAKTEPPKDNPLVQLLKRQSPAGAGVLLGLLALPPLAILVLSAADGWNGWCTVSAALLVAAAIPAAATLFRFSWANAAGQYLCWAELIQVALRIMTTGFKPVLAFPAGLAVVALLTLTSAQPAPVAAKERAPESLQQWLKENIEAIVVAFIMALVIRCFCIEVFKIPSSSMEPTLLGDISEQHRIEDCPFKAEHQTPGGDRIMVTKFFYAFAPVERYDVVVFKFPLNQSKNFIKRVVGLPNEELRIYHGNIFVRPPDIVHLKNGGKLEGWVTEKGDKVEVGTATGTSSVRKDEVARIEKKDFQIARRTLRTQDSIWIPVDAKPETPMDYLESREVFGTRWKDQAVGGKKAQFGIAQRELTTAEDGGARSIRFERKEAIEDGAHQEIGELQLSFDFELTSSKGEVFAEIVNEYGRFEARLSTETGCQLRFHAPGSEDKSVTTSQETLKNVALTVDHRYHFALSVYDGTAYLRVDDAMVWINFITTRESVVLNDSPKRLVAFGARDGTFKVRHLMLGRDVFYKGKPSYERKNIEEDVPVKIDPDCYVMMGDNVENSHDARSWSKRVYYLKGGGEVVCEAQDINNNRTIPREEVLQRYGLEASPTTIISADQYGVPWALYSESAAKEAGIKPRPGVGILDPNKQDDTQTFYMVPQKFIVGKALWIWWPKGRWFRLIR